MRAAVGVGNENIKEKVKGRYIEKHVLQQWILNYVVFVFKQYMFLSHSENSDLGRED